jgi:hypothetical protein
LEVLRRLVQAVEKRDLDLRESNLAGADLMGMYLLEAQLNGANLAGARLNGAYLVGADLRGAVLEGAQFYKANLTDVRLCKGQIGMKALVADDVLGVESVQVLEPETAAAQPVESRRPPPSSRRGRSQLRQPPGKETGGTLRRT